MSNAVPVLEGLFSWPNKKPALQVTHCRQCLVVAFPRVEYCPSCASSDVEFRQLESIGKLRNFTSVLMRPPEYKGEVPYGVGIVEFPEGICILGLLTVSDLGSLRPGMNMEVVVETVYKEDGNDIVSYKFHPSQEAGHA
ncbi:OB-fold domain-containing protein [Castellaniella sp. GW247-6E4]|uniref:Zn-ribbon domain-containing OB-fold protein n=1 Tax=Castellaniella sp. GW247-6E4 TaxID=3140380 RepID=UPI003314F73C